MKKHIIAGTILIIGLVIAVVYTRNSITTTPEAQVEDTDLGVNTSYVSFDGASFTPSVIRVKAGTKVYFNNLSTSERPMYVASDEHPTHEAYPGFEQIGAGGSFPAPGENFSFTFKKIGTWAYHDHNYPSATGTVIVE